VIESYKDLAFSEYARVGRALALYEVGDREEAIAEMEDVSISLKGYPGKFNFIAFFVTNHTRRKILAFLLCYFFFSSRSTRSSCSSFICR
jgi:hypothetical protein